MDDGVHVGQRLGHVVGPRKIADHGAGAAFGNVVGGRSSTRRR